MNIQKVIEMKDMFGDGQTGQLVYCGKVPRGYIKGEFNRIPGVECLSWTEILERLKNK